MTPLPDGEVTARGPIIPCVSFVRFGGLTTEKIRKDNSCKMIYQFDLPPFYKIRLSFWAMWVAPQ